MQTVVITVSKTLYEEAVEVASREGRSAAEQICLWANVGRNAFANPDLSVGMIQDLLLARLEPTEAFEFEES